MSWDVEMIHPETREIATLPVSHEDGGTYVLGGNKEAHLNITYNYSRLFKLHLCLEGLSYLDQKKGEEVIVILTRAVGLLGVKTDPDYWKPTLGNAGHTLNILLQWARWFPEYIFRVR